MLKYFITCKPVSALRNAIFWLGAPCGWVIASRRFERTYRFRLQVYESVYWLLSMRKSAARFCESSRRNYPKTRRNKPEDLLLEETSTLCFRFLYFHDRASPYNFLLITNLTHFFMSLFISCLYMFRASQRPSSGDRIVLIHHLVWLVCVSDCMVCRHTGIPSSHLHRLIIPDDVLIQFDLLVMSAVTLETCRDMK